MYAVKRSKAINTLRRDNKEVEEHKFGTRLFLQAGSIGKSMCEDENKRTQ